MRSVILIVVTGCALHVGAVRAQIDSVSRPLHIRDTVAELGGAAQLGFSAAAFLVGFIPDGYSHINRQLYGGEPHVVSIMITPFLTSAAVDFAKSHFWKLDDHDGSYFAGVVGGFLGEVIGSMIAGFAFDKPTYTKALLSFLVPTVLFTTLFYNYFGQ